MRAYKILLAVTLLGLASACSVTGPADDGFDNSLESVDIGKLQDGALLSGYLSKVTDTKSKK